jgi:hypothetical protein
MQNYVPAIYFTLQFSLAHCQRMFSEPFTSGAETAHQQNVTRSVKERFRSNWYWNKNPTQQIKLQSIAGLFFESDGGKGFSIISCVVVTGRISFPLLPVFPAEIKKIIPYPVISSNT